MTDLLDQLFGGNDLLSGGIVLMAMGAALAALRKVPGHLLVLALRTFTVEVDILGADPAFGWLRIWLAEHPYSRRARRLSASVRIGNRDAGVDDGPLTPSSQGEGKARIVLSPAPGTHLLRRGGSWVLLRRRRDEVEGARGIGGAWRESYHLRILGRSPEAARVLLEEARQAAERWGKAPGVRAFVREYASWQFAATKPERAADSVILPGNTLETILDDARQFAASRDWYEGRGIPYRRGYLFHGMPGSGKSSVVLALASALGRPVYDLRLSDTDLNETNLLGAMRQTEGGGILLAEDIDAVPITRARDVNERGEGRGITLAALLNALDGVTAPEGRILVMTTNHPEHLDPALIRPGRVDRRVAFGPATPEQATRLFGRFYPEVAEDLAHRFGLAVEGHGVSMAAIQEHLLRHRDSPVDALIHAPDLGAGAVARALHAVPR